MGQISEKRMQHPLFWRFNNDAHDALWAVLKKHGVTPDKMDGLETHAGRVVDDLTSLLLRASKTS
jgi:hypothetical protein